MRWKTLTPRCSKFIQEIMCQISSQLPKFCRRYYRKHFGLFFFWTRCMLNSLFWSLVEYTRVNDGAIRMNVMYVSYSRSRQAAMDGRSLITTYIHAWMWNFDQRLKNISQHVTGRAHSTSTPPILALSVTGQKCHNDRWNGSTGPCSMTRTEPPDHKQTRPTYDDTKTGLFKIQY